MATYRIERWSKGPDGADVWTPKKGGLTQERAEHLVASAKLDARTSLATFRIVEEEPAPVELLGMYCLDCDCEMTEATADWRGVRCPECADQRSARRARWLLEIEKATGQLSA